MRKRDQQAYVNQRAFELADTGRYSDEKEIEKALLAEGFREARDWLDSANIRNDLRNVCLAAKARGSRAVPGQ